MALSKKPVKLQPFVSEDIVSALINKGGSVPAEIPVAEVAKKADGKQQKKVLKVDKFPCNCVCHPKFWT